MQNPDVSVLRDALNWLDAGHGVELFTVVQTWGSAPRPCGALVAVRDDGAISGSVSGGCVEDILVEQVKATSSGLGVAPGLLSFGVSADEAARFGLPCGGRLQLLQENLSMDWARDLLHRVAQGQRVLRTLNLATGETLLSEAKEADGFAFDGLNLWTVFGPAWRLLLIGAGQLSQLVARVAVLLDFEVLVCDPRAEYVVTFDTHLGPLAHVRRVAGMPDDVVRAILPDAHTAIVALTHDPKLDDLALLEALPTAAFYVGALGSKRNQIARKLRLSAHFGMTDYQLNRLHGPVGLALGGKTPAEIAVSIVAHIIQVRNQPSTCVLAAVAGVKD